jgi:hypothetical protein
MRKQLTLLFIPLVALCLSVVLLGRASADDRSDARAHYQTGVQLYNSGDYRGAVREFNAAQQLLPADLNSYNLALCYDKLGDTDSAIKYYRTYLDAVPNTDKRGEVQAALDRLDAQQKAAQKKADDDRRTAAAAEAQRQPPPAPPAPSDDANQRRVDANALRDQVPPAAGTMQPAPQPTGDAQLDSVNGVDINSLRAQRGLGAQGQMPPQGQQQLSNGAAPQGGMQPGPGQPPMAGQPVGDKTVAPAPATVTPIYKKWWFWVVIGVSVFVIYEIASDNSQPSNNTTAREDALTGANFGRSNAGMRAGSMPTGLTLLRW